MVRTNENVARMPERQTEREIPVRGGGLSGLRNEMSRLFGRTPAYAGRRGGDLPGPEAAWFARDPFEWLESALDAGLGSFGQADVSETDKAYELEIDLPGMKKDDVSVDYSDGVITIAGERRDEREDERKGYYLSERSHGTFQRSFRVPESVDHENISAKFTDGVLTVELPKTEESRETSRRIDVKEG
mgnify:CR=1 FL=1